MAYRCKGEVGTAYVAVSVDAGWFGLRCEGYNALSSTRTAGAYAPLFSETAEFRGESGRFGLSDCPKSANSLSRIIP